MVGIVTDRDIRLNLPSPATSLSVWEINYLLAKLTVGGVMTTSVIIVDPDRPIAEAARIMMDHKIGALPVVEEGRLVGIVTESDFVRAMAEPSQPHDRNDPRRRRRAGPGRHLRAAAAPSRMERGDRRAAARQR